ncbi:MAG: hypothetical protein C0598_12365 [Marinilabiliales bacterium]|nr:MAG: hypothetical protein C0598_12365 [Marinilabiliales bacterium]
MKQTKTICILLTFLLASINVAEAQGEIMEANVSATLESVLILNIDPDVNVEFGIVEVSQNLYQITRKPEDIHFSVESTGNWNLSVSASDNYFTCIDDSSCKIPIDFVSYQIENKGTNWDNGLFSNIANRTKDTTLSLSQNKTTVLVNGNKNNIGGAEQNSFVLRWYLNFDDDLLKIDEFYKYKIKEGYYKADFFITLTENKKL